MTGRPEPVSFLARLSRVVQDDTEYQVRYRAWQIKEIIKYIETLEKETDSE